MLKTLLRAAIGLSMASCVYVDMRPGSVLKKVDTDDIGTARNDAVREQGMADLQCGDVTVTPEPTPDLFASGPLTATGCGKTELYEEVVCGSSWRYIPVTRPIADPNRYAGADANCTGSSVVALAKYPPISVDGARDLACPREKVIPKRIYTGPHVYTAVAEGCGKRATYLPGGGALSSVVDIRP